ncbi:MAG: hypothetical protein ACK6D2_20395, partial [Planctomycetota bacterium]
MSGASGGEDGGEPGGERLLSVAEARALDADARDRLGLPTRLLRENAARLQPRLQLAHVGERRQ